MFISQTTIPQAESKFLMVFHSFYCLFPVALCLDSALDFVANYFYHTQRPPHAFVLDILI